MSLDEIFRPAQPGEEDYGDSATSLDHLFGMAPKASPDTRYYSQTQAAAPASSGFNLGNFLGEKAQGLIGSLHSGLDTVGEFLDTTGAAIKSGGNDPSQWFGFKPALEGLVNVPQAAATAGITTLDKLLGGQANPEEVQTQVGTAFGALGAEAGGASHAGSLERATEGGSLRAPVVDTTARVGRVRPAAIEAPPVRAALPSGPYADPFLEAERQGAMTRPQLVRDQLARQAPGESGPAIPQPAPAPISMGDLRPRAPLSAADIQAIPAGPTGPAPFEVRYGAARDAEAAGRDARAAVAAADARWQGLRSDVRASNPPESSTLPARGGLTGRGIQTTPTIGRENLTLTGRTAAAPPEVAPLTLADLNTRGATARSLDELGVPRNADELSARIGATPPSELAKARAFSDTGPAQMAAKDAFAREVEARQAQVKGPIAESGMSGPLVGRAFGKGGSQLTRTGATGISAADLSASLERQSRVHQANEAFITAMKANDFPAAERAVRDVHLLNGSLDHTSARAKAAGVSAPSGAEMRKWLKAGGTNEVPAKAPSVPAGRGGLLNRLGTFTKEDIGGGPLPGDKGRYGTPQEVRAARLAGTSPSGNARIPQAPVGRDWLRTAGRVAGPIVRDVATLPKTLVTPLAPFHAALRHAAPLVLAPSKDLRFQRAWVEGWKGAGRAVWTDLSKPGPVADAAILKRTNQMRDNLAANGASTIQIIGKHTADEMVPSRILTSIPGFGRVFRAGKDGFTQFGNEARYAAAKFTIQGAKRGDLADGEGARVFERINHFTGQGFDLRNKPEFAQKLGEMSAIPFFSPKLQASYARQIKDVLGALAHPTRPSSQAALQLGTGQLAATGGMLLAGAALGLPVILNMTDSNFGKVDLGTKDDAKATLALLASQVGVGTTSESNGHVYLDATHGMAGYIKALAQTIGDIAAGGHNQYGDVNVGDPIANLFINHLSPGVHEVGQGVRAFLDPRHRKDEISPLSAVTPITVSAPLEAGGGALPGQFNFNDLVPKGTSAPQPGAAPRATPARTTAPRATTAPKSSPRPTARPTR